MILPSKVTPYNASIFPQAVFVAKKLCKQDKKILSLYSECRSTIPDVSIFLLLLDFLYATGKIELTENGELHYVA